MSLEGVLKPRISGPEELPQEDREPVTLTELAWTLQTQAQRESASQEEKESFGRIATQLLAGTINDADLESRDGLRDTIARLQEARARNEAVYEKSTPLEVAPGLHVPLHRIGGEDSESPGEGTKLLIAPGCFTGPLQLRDFAVASAAYGGDVIAPEMLTPDQGRSIDVERSKDMTDVVSAYRHTLEATMRAVAEGKEGEKFDLLGFSTGAAAVVDAALRDPEKIRHVILVSPIGLHSLESGYIARFAGIIKGANAGYRQTKEKGLLSDPTYQQFSKDYASRQMFRGHMELLEIVHAAAMINLTPLIAELKTKGIEVTVIMSEDDKQINAEEVEQSVAKAPGCGYLVVTGAHTKIGAEPQALAALVADIRRGDMR